ncbi:MAG: hypothetical protein A2133_12160 [Actinobacteria bacterium RBG_16_64_13]|nr:MAG: hypothetical protein A2133_12160 [Actinobacteria bacterium RBG_16_64_13]
MVGLVHNDGIERGRTLPQLVEEGLSGGERHRDNEARLLREDVYRWRALSALEKVCAIPEDVEAEPELRPHLALPALRLWICSRHDEDAAGLMTLGEPSKDKASLRGLAKPGVIRDEQTWPNGLRRPHEGNELVGLDSHGTPVEANKLLTTAGHGGQERPMKRAPSGTIASLNLESWKRENVRLKSVALERQERGYDLVAVCGLDPDQLDETPVFFTGNAPTPSAPTDGLPSLEKR